MEDATEVARNATSDDPAVGLRAVRALRKLVVQLETAQVESARRQGWSWEKIAGALGVTRQAAFKKHAGR